MLSLQSQNKKLSDVNTELVIKLKDMQLKYETKTIHLEHEVDAMQNKIKSLEEEMLRNLQDANRNTDDQDRNRKVDSLSQQLERQREAHVKEIEFWQNESERAVKDIKHIYQQVPVTLYPRNWTVFRLKLERGLRWRT